MAGKQILRWKQTLLITLTLSCIISFQASTRMISDMQSLKEGLEESALQTTTTITSLDWTQFGLGLGLGAITDISSNVSN